MAFASKRREEFVTARCHLSPLDDHDEEYDENRAITPWESVGDSSPLPGSTSDNSIYVKYGPEELSPPRRALTRQIAIDLRNPPKAPAAQQEATSTPVMIADELEKLDALRQRGVLTQQEFDAQKAKLLR